MSAPFHCVVTDTTNSVIYALSSFAFSNDKLNRIVVLRSNPNPKSVDTITWTVVSSIDANAFYDLKQYTPDCVVSDSGIFTAISSGFSNSNYEKVSRGFQYDPEGKSTPGFQQTGSGGWSNITFNGFVWPGDELYRGSLFTYLSSGEKTSGTSTLALLTYNQSTIRLGTFDSATKTVIPASTWNLDPTFAGFGTPISEVAYDKGNLYVYVYSAFKVLMFPLTSLPAVLPSSPISFNATQ
ncbi:hypothetical protein BGX26_003744 [Mortierella sp. AD094]|nr:hypothetical protein BGX26_003744 [Mortierella sp. AD094]